MKQISTTFSILVVMLAFYFGADRLMKKFFLRQAWSSPAMFVNIHDKKNPMP